MLDVFNINDNSLSNQVFYFTGTNAWQTWHKPPNTKFINFFLLGGGAGGQSGGLNAASTRNGGAGGGSAAFTYITVPSFAVPDMLYIQVGGGGLGGSGTTGNTQGVAGGLSYVSLTPDSSIPHMILMRSGSDSAGYGGVSSRAGLAITATDIILSEIAFLSTYAGQAGGSGGVSSGAAANVTPTGKPFTGGAGGAGCSSVGVLGTSANINGIFSFPTISGGTNTTVGGATAGAGADGFGTRNTFLGNGFKNVLYFTGGAGGGATASSTGIGGAGGDASFGCGGGGGGAGGNTRAGDGGRGGDGLVIITTS